MTCAGRGSSMKNRWSSFLVGGAAGASAVGGAAPGLSGTRLNVTVRESILFTENRVKYKDKSLGQKEEKKFKTRIRITQHDFNGHTCKNPASLFYSSASFMRKNNLLPVKK